MIWIRTKQFAPDQNNLYLVQIKKDSQEESDLNLTKMIWTQPKQTGLNQNNLYPSKIIWISQNHFEPIEGQGISSYTPPIAEILCVINPRAIVVCGFLMKSL